MGVSCSDCQMAILGEPKRFESRTYIFIVGRRLLHINYLSKCLSSTTGQRMTHHCLLYDDDIFELVDSGFSRKNKKSCSDFYEYTWIEKYKGRSDINPDDLEKKIKNEISTKYNPFTNNCQHFVRFCLKILAPNNNIMNEEYEKEETCIGIFPHVPCI